MTFLLIVIISLIIGLICDVSSSSNKNREKDMNSLENEDLEENLDFEIVYPHNQKSDTLKVELKDGQIDTSKIIEYNGKEIPNFEFRPQTWEQFIGQEKNKERIKTVRKKAERGMKAHFLVDGIKGHGKTTYIELFAKDIGAKLIQRVGKQIEVDNLVDIINEINQSKEKYVIFFVDEIETMDWKVIKVLNPIIEQFKIQGKKIKPFIFAGATINKHILLKNNPDTLDRIPTKIKFTRYTIEEIMAIVRQCKEQLYPKDEISEKVIRKIAENCKYNPRTSQALLDEYIVLKDINKVLEDCHIVKDGLNNTDIKILKILSKSKRPMGANAIALRCGLSQKEYEREFEPFLYEFEYINRTPSRSLSDKGKEFLKNLKKGE